MALRICPAAALAFFLAVTTVAEPRAGQSLPSAAQPSPMVVVTNAVGRDGARYLYEISQERSDGLPVWDQRATSEPSLSMSEARKAAETWLAARDPDIKTFDVASVSLFRINPASVPTAPCRLTGCWYYRLMFDPVVGGRRLTGGGDFTVIVLLDGSIVEPRVDVGPAVISGGRGGGESGGPGSGTGGGAGPRSSSGQTSGSGVGTGAGTVYRAGGDVTSPRVVRQVRTQYTDAAMRAKVQGNVLLEAVVNTNGTVGDVKVIRSLDSVYGLDEEAVKAVRQWRFTPGTRMGVPVPVLITLEMTFSLR